MRLVYYICAILAGCLLLCGFYMNMQKKEINTLKSENKQLEATIKGYQKELKRQEEIKENVRERENAMEKTDKKDKGAFDWDTDISGLASVVELRKQCKSCADSTD